MRRRLAVCALYANLPPDTQRACLAELSGNSDTDGRRMPIRVVFAPKPQPIVEFTVEREELEMRCTDNVY